MPGGVRDPYEILGLPRNASEADIRDAFRRLAREHHPDRNPSDPSAQQRFQEINAAHQLLSDPQKRAHFDRFGSTSRSSRPPPQSVNVEDLFGDLFRGFGGQGFGGAPAPSGDLQMQVELTFEEAALGCNKSLRYQRVDHCSQCEGSGATKQSGFVSCASCGGSGRVQLGVAGLLGLLAARPCDRCQGTGQIPKSPCEPCRGSGLLQRTREIAVTIPPGIEDGASQRVHGGGNRAVRGQTPGDLELTIRVQAHEHFRRENDDVHSKVKVPFTTAALGGTTSVPTLHGPTDLVIPAGTQHGSQLRLRGQGVPHRFRSGRGDHFCEVSVTVPSAPSERVRELVQRLDEDVEPEGIFDRVKAWLGGDDAP
jgi:molecular chaperone DnaJ